MSNNDKAVRSELDQQIGRVGKQLAQEKDQRRRQQLRDQGRNLVRRRSYHVDDNEIVSYANRKEEAFLCDLMSVLLEKDAYSGKNQDWHDNFIGKNKEAEEDKDKKKKLTAVVADRPDSERAPREIDKAFDRIMQGAQKKGLKIRGADGVAVSTTTDQGKEHTPPKENRPRYAYKRGQIIYADGSASHKREEAKKAKEAKEVKQKERRKDQLRRMQQANIKEAMNFTDYCNSLIEPIFEVKGSLPKCPPGYRYSREQKQCVPKTEKDDVRLNKGGSKDSNPSNGPGYNVWGRTGVNGDGYAWAEPNDYQGNYYDGPSGGYYN